MLNNISTVLLRKIFIASAAYSTGLDAVKFRAENHEHLDVLDQLQSDGYLDNRDGKYYLKLISLREISDSTPQVSKLLYLCEHLFDALKKCYIDRPGKGISLDRLSEIADLPKQEIIIGLSYMKETPVFGGWSTDFHAKDASVTPSEGILRHKSFDHVMDTIIKWQKNGEQKIQPIAFFDAYKKNNKYSALFYVDPQRIEELKIVKSNRFYLMKLIRICDELNSCLEHSNYFAIASLVRMILDHIPPILGYSSFKEVANNYGGKSLKHSLQHLENSSRKISDSLLHQKIRKTESLPTKVMVDFSSDVDVLLSEIIRVIREEQISNNRGIS